MGLSDLTVEILGIPEPSARFLVALYGGELIEFMSTRGRWQRPRSSVRCAHTDYKLK